MEKIPTALDFYKKWQEETDKRIMDPSIPRDTNIMEDLLLKFAKLHVKAALKQAYDKVYMDDGTEYMTREEIEYVSPRKYTINKSSILNSYPESNIK